MHKSNREIEKHLVEVLEKEHNVIDAEILTAPLGNYADSLTIVDLACDVESYYNIILEESEFNNWPDMSLREISKQIESKLV